MASASESTKPKSRLGRGLSSLLSVQESPVQAEVPAASTTAPPATSVAIISGDETEAARPTGLPRPQSDRALLELPVDRITANPHQPRRDFDEQGINELAASLKSNGLIQPVVVKRAGDRYELIAGERRLRAAKVAGLTAIPAIVREADSFTQAQMALVENIQRRDLNPVDRAHAYRNLMQQLGLTQAEIGIRLGEDRSTIANYLRLLDLIDAVADLLREEKLTLGHAKLLASVTDPVEQLRLAKLVVSQDLSVRNLERLVAAPEKLQQVAARKPTSAHVQDLERSLSRQLGMRVNLQSGKGGKGRVTIHYGSLDQFDALVERLGVALD